MIKNNEQDIFLVDDATGEEKPLDMEAVLDMLDAAFRKCGVCDAWIPDDLLDILGKRVKECSQDTDHTLSQTDVNDMLAGALAGTGFADVARAFKEIAQEECVLPENCGSDVLERRDWSVSELESLLDETEEFAGCSRKNELAGLVSESIARLNLAGGVTRELAFELARNIWNKLQTDEAESAREPVNAPGEPETVHSDRLALRTQYIAADQWAPECSRQLQELLRLHIVRLCPASDILPVAVVECNLSRIFDLPQPPREESELVAMLEQLCGELQTLLAQMHSRMLECWPALQSTCSHVRFNHYEAFLRMACRSRHRRELAALRARLAELFNARLAGSELSLSYT